VKWFRKAAQQGWSPSQYNLGWMYERGRGVPQSHADAVKWYCLAAKRGNSRAKHDLSMMAEKGSSLADRCLWEYKDTSVKYLQRSMIVILFGLLALVLVCGGSIGAVYLGFSKLKVINNWQRILIGISIAITLLWMLGVIVVGVVVYVALSQGHFQVGELLEFLLLHMHTATFALVPAAALWGFLYTGFWMTRGSARQMDIFCISAFTGIGFFFLAFGYLHFFIFTSPNQGGLDGLKAFGFSLSMAFGLGCLVAVFLSHRHRDEQ